MLKISKYLVPLFEGAQKKGFLHVAVVDEAGYVEMISHVDKNDSFANDVENWPAWEDFAGLAYERKTKVGPKDWWMIIPISGNSKVSIDTVAHESLHIARMILTSRGVLFDPNNDEPYAYLVGWIAGKAYDSIPSKYLKTRPTPSKSKTVVSKKTVASKKRTTKVKRKK
jgi:hypothetical protein